MEDLIVPFSSHLSKVTQTGIWSGMEPDQERRGPVAEARTLTGTPVTVGTLTVTPVARSFVFGREVTGERLDDGAGGMGHLEAFWFLARPSSVLVSDGSGTTRVPIVDVTRLAQALMVILALLWLCETWIRTRRRKGR